MDGVLEVVVAYRYGCGNYSWTHIEDHWDIRVTRMWFAYQQDEFDNWVWDLAPSQQSGQLPDSAMQASGSGQTHPDIAIDQASGDIYCAWTNLTQYNGSNLFYKIFRDDEWSEDPFSLKYEDREHDPWYVNLDIGLVDNLPDMSNPERIVGFAYTGNFSNLPDEEPFPLWGFRPVVGFWSIEDYPNGGNHPAQYVLVNSAFTPVEDGAKYYAGLPVVDIPADGVTYHGAGLAFVQDEEDDGPGYYEVYGISSLNYTDFTHISSTVGEEFTHATLPSLAVHRTDGTMASVTYFAKEDDTEWAVWATLWTLDVVNEIAEPTLVDYTALGEFEMDENDFLFHDWGTSSSLVLIGTYDNYWAAWSNKMYPAGEPTGVRGAMGYTEQ